MAPRAEPEAGPEAPGGSPSGGLLARGGATVSGQTAEGLESALYVLVHRFANHAGGGALASSSAAESCPNFNLTL